MPLTDSTSRTNFGGGSTPLFPSFLPLEIFDNTEYDCRTPKDWLALGQLSILTHTSICMHVRNRKKW